MIRTYCAVLGEYPIEAVMTSAQNLLAGRVEGYDGRFAPTPPQWAKEARRCHAAMLPDRPRAIEPERVISSEERARVGELIADLARSLGAKARPAPDHVPPVTPEEELEALKADPGGFALSPAALAKVGVGG